MVNWWLPVAKTTQADPGAKEKNQTAHPEQKDVTIVTKTKALAIMKISGGWSPSGYIDTKYRVGLAN
jgi:hypothetical protein